MTSLSLSLSLFHLLLLLLLPPLAFQTSSPLSSSHFSIRQATPMLSLNFRPSSFFFPPHLFPLHLLLLLFSFPSLPPPPRRPSKGVAKTRRGKKGKMGEGKRGRRRKLERSLHHSPPQTRSCHESQWKYVIGDRQVRCARIRRRETLLRRPARTRDFPKQLLLLFLFRKVSTLSG